MDRLIDIILNDRIFHILLACITGLWLLSGLLEEIFAGEEKPKARINPRISKIGFCRQVVRWCVSNMGVPKDRVVPGLSLSYVRKAGKVLGTYSFSQRHIRIFVQHPEHRDLLQLIDTIIHEYQHHLEITDGKKSKLYDQKTAEVGYQNNPFEVSARKTAEALREKAYRHLVDKNLILEN